jgi:hypothetical protein
MAVMLIIICTLFTNNQHIQNTIQIPPAKNNAKAKIELLKKFADAFNAHDVNVIMSCMTDDCIFEASAGNFLDGEKFVGMEAVSRAFAKPKNIFWKKANNKKLPHGYFWEQVRRPLSQA